MAIFIGIDPGVHTGFAVWDTNRRDFTMVATFNIVVAMENTRREWERASIQDCRDMVVVMEDARQRQWLPRERNLSEYRGKLMGAGSIRRDCEIWEEFCTHLGIRLVKIPPRKGLTKWTADYFARVTGWKGRTSNHARDAALLVFNK